MDRQVYDKNVNKICLKMVVRDNISVMLFKFKKIHPNALQFNPSAPFFDCTQDDKSLTNKKNSGLIAKKFLTLSPKAFSLKYDSRQFTSAKFSLKRLIKKKSYRLVKLQIETQNKQNKFLIKLRLRLPLFEIIFTSAIY
ncbi:hypothetical protein BpHYR1_039398 [Brachionus plicatilis]|uniref:Uncharacterized protein n=1 Tax=Brachionus plicatilis TaxID=10195 RepID=A0A3M7SV02_BRAPC|nr:hypothetical protein BpHYR1_039398 [Brachionus plicatilis]